MKIKKTPYYSWKIGNLAKGCQLCVKGEKSVLFVTGLCSSSCFYCPISDKKKNKDVVYINEWETGKFDEIKTEIKLCDSKGVGITGGDPLVKLERTLFLIKKLKKEFGKNFHIHLYTPLRLVNNKNLEKLYKAGLDEIRFHPDFKNKKDWGKINPAKNFKWKVGIEIPVIPGMKNQTIDLIKFLGRAKIDFLNLNELEISDTNAQKLIEKGFIPKDRVSYGVLGSEKLAFELLDYINQNKLKLNVHYCTTKLKDRVQLAKRIKKRALNAAKDYDIVTVEGILVRGAVYLEEIYPSFGYERKLKEIKNKKTLITKLRDLRNQIIKKLKLNKNLAEIDENKLRILTQKSLVKKIKEEFNNKNLRFAIVREYPTYDAMQTELEFV